MPEPAGRGQRYMPGLDGLRAFAVLAVVAYHLNFGWAGGGLLGVGVFFTLSGYLITDLLLGQWSRLGKLNMGDFWIRRARRLLPALFLMLVVVTIWVSLADRSQLGELRGQVGAATLYVSNWWQIFHHISYFDRFGPPSPLNHLWSLAVEEQFYLIWPWLLLLGLRFVRERDPSLPVRPRLAAVTLALGLASAIEMALLYHPSFDASRIYDATDTRAFGLLFGAALAMVWPSRNLRAPISRDARRILDTAGTAGLVVIALLIWRTDQYSAFPYYGGMVLLSIATVLAVAALAHPATRVGRAMGWGPLRWIGVRSYGIYLWHVPVILLTTKGVTGSVNLSTATLQVGATLAIADLSWRYVEQPIRRGAIGRLWGHFKSARWRPRALPRQANAALGAACAAVALACVALTGVSPPGPVSAATAGIRIDGAQLASSPTPGGANSVSSTSSISASSQNAPVSTRTSCRAVVHIGDSTSEGMISSDYLPERRDRLPARYRRVGVRHPHMQITGATSIVETLPGGTNAYDVARRLIHNGYHGCWVIALGTNDTADVFVGSSVSLTTRIQRMMSVLRDQPVMWVNARSLVAGGPYSESNMQEWNDALLGACSRYANVRVFDWASAAQPEWFIPDGIHYTSPGYAARARLIAAALAQAFPAGPDAQYPGCVVHARSAGPPQAKKPAGRA